jgi:hypothetical protein
MVATAEMVAPGLVLLEPEAVREGAPVPVVVLGPPRIIRVPASYAVGAMVAPSLRTLRPRDRRREEEEVALALALFP